MKKLIISVFTMILSLCMLVGCTNNQNANNQGGNIPDIPSGGNAGTATIPDELTEIPSQYNQVAERQGTLVEIYYDTYESFSYADQSRPLEKRAIVYLPYGYS